MGFDVFGLGPSTDAGDYFRNSIAWWHPLWRFVLDHCGDILTDEEKVAGQFNDGQRFSATTAHVLAARLRRLVEDGTVARHAKAERCFTEENVRAFVAFLRHCGGFQVC